MVTRQLQVERRTAKVCQSKTNVLPLYRAINVVCCLSHIQVSVMFSKNLCVRDSCMMWRYIEPLNDMNKAEGGRTSRPVDKVNIATDASCAGDTADVTDVERLMCQVAAELHVDAQQAITSLKKDKDLWNRVERLKQDAATRRGAVSDHGTAVNVDTSMCCCPVYLNVTLKLP